MNMIITIAIFFVTVLAHIFLFRKINSGKRMTLPVFIAGFIMVTVLNLFILKSANYDLKEWRQVYLPFSSIFIFILLTGSYFILLTSVFLDDESPSTKIYSLIRRKEKMGLSDLINQFSNKTLIIKRLHELEKAGFVYKKRKYQILPKGKILVSLINHYKNTLGWKIIG